MKKDEENIDNKKARKINCKLHINISARRKRDRSMEIKNLIIKIANLASNEKDKFVNECAHVLEDTLNKFYKIKGIKNKALNYAFVDADNSGVPQTTEDSIIEDELSIFRDRVI